MNIYFDTEFTGLKKDTTLVSIGLISETNETFYAEFTDYDKSYNDPWFIENVLNNLVIKNEKIPERLNIANKTVRGSKDFVAKVLKSWLDKFDDVQLVSDVCHYDMVLFIDLFGGAFDLPSNINPSCHDINQDIAKYFNISEKEAFDYNREKIAVSSVLNGKYKHNSLYDAKIIKMIYELIHR